MQIGNACRNCQIFAIAIGGENREGSAFGHHRLRTLRHTSTGMTGSKLNINTRQLARLRLIKQSRSTNVGTTGQFFTIFDRRIAQRISRYHANLELTGNRVCFSVTFPSRHHEPAHIAFVNGDVSQGIAELHCGRRLAINRSRFRFFNHNFEAIENLVRLDLNIVHTSIPGSTTKRVITTLIFCHTRTRDDHVTGIATISHHGLHSHITTAIRHSYAISLS